MKSIIHVNRHFIAMNVKDGGNRPVYTIKQGKKIIYCRSFIADGPITGVSDTNKLSCGARVWLETKSNVTFIDPMTFKEAQKYELNSKTS